MGRRMGLRPIKVVYDQADACGIELAFYPVINEVGPVLCSANFGGRGACICKRILAVVVR